jgi:solute carrier family 25 phosphate transporter 23/24/25/41
MQSEYKGQIQVGNYGVATSYAISSSFAASVTYPLSLLRTRLQMQGTLAHQYRYTGLRDVAWKTLKTEGLFGFYKGLTPNLLKVVPGLSMVSNLPVRLNIFLIFI